MRAEFEFEFYPARFRAIADLTSLYVTDRNDLSEMVQGEELDADVTIKGRGEFYTRHDDATS